MPDPPRSRHPSLPAPLPEPVPTGHGAPPLPQYVAALRCLLALGSQAFLPFRPWPFRSSGLL
ncbi:hypothetical protein EBL87_01705 [Cereibacter sphaeroides]|nr:hypothetical protein EBL87_01705 [Cereibacter sphaeroides]AZB69546.1 hypothetical protein EBL86_14720 [Cereibacter sphaeroides]